VVGGEALVEVTSSAPVLPSARLNGQPVEARFVAGEAAGKWRAVISGLTVGDNTIEASAGERTGTLSVRNYPVQGPLISGPHLHPWALTTEESGLGAPFDEYGNTPARIAYHYMSASSGEFADYDPEQPPAADDVATTTTDMGVTVPYIVRLERGAANRGIYELAVLCNPAQPWTGAQPQQGWNGKLWIYLYGGWNQYWSQSVLMAGGPPPLPSLSILIDMGLRRGFMIARTTLAQSATNSDSVRGAESLLVLKDHITKRYGPIRYTFGSGASGGSIMQQMIANQYPGIFQGLMPLSSLVSTWYVPSVLLDSQLLEHYFSTVSPTMWENEADRLAVDGHRAETTRQFFNTVFGSDSLGAFVGGNDPTNGTGLPEADNYHPERNPAGARGTLQDYQVNYLGRRHETQWTAAERAAGHGFAPLPWGNSAVQYGLGALLAGRISAAQFVDLNEKIGGVDIDNTIVPSRTEADPDAVAKLHRGGFLNDFVNMDTVAILDVRPPEADDLPSHTQFHTWVARAELTAAHGHADNHIAWMIPGFASIGAPPEAAFVAMDQWLAAVEADESHSNLAEKIVANKPASLLDGVYDLQGVRTGDLDDYHRLYPSYGNARTVAANGNLHSVKIAKPQLKPLDLADYPGVDFTDEQWLRLHQVFPHGVADWTKPGVGQTPTTPWLTYASGPGGEPLQPAAQSSGDPSREVTERYRASRDQLLSLRTDYTRAVGEFTWPDMGDRFNWAVDWFDAYARDNEQPGLIIVEEDGSATERTFAQLSTNSDRLATWLADQGVKKGERVIVMLGNQVELWETMLAVMKLGAVIMPTATAAGPNELQDRFTRGQARHAICNVSDVTKFDQVPGDYTRISVGAVEGWANLHDAQQLEHRSLAHPNTAPNDPLLLYFTSGTTSLPKLVAHTQVSYPVGHLSTMYYIGLQPGDVHLNISSPGWAKHAWSCFFAPLIAEATIFIYNYKRFNAAALLQQINDRQVTTFCAPPTVWRMLIQAELGEKPGAVRELLSAGEPLNPEVIEQVKKAWGITIRDGFGQTETTAQVGNSPGQAVKPGSMGRPLPGMPVVLVDPVSGQRLTGVGEGEICLDLSSGHPLPLMTGYQGDPERNTEAMAGGFYHTGDVASVDADGYITYIGRTDDVFKASDYKISPFELESALIEHPAVAEAAVVPAPDSIRLAVPKAYIALAQGYQPDEETARSILKYAREHLAPYQRVRRVEFFELPKTISGKIRRVELRTREQELAEAPRESRTEWRDTDFPDLSASTETDNGGASGSATASGAPVAPSEGSASEPDQTDGAQPVKQQGRRPWPFGRRE
jgi:acetyl-CoA synthetase